MNYATNTTGTLDAGEAHPAAISAYRWIMSNPIVDLMRLQEAFATTAIENNRLAEVCSETLNRLLTGKPVSDRYVLGLAWAIKDIGCRETSGEKL